MYKLFLLLFWLTLAKSGFGQEIFAETDKSEFPIHETVKLTYTTDFHVDSIDYPEWNTFTKYTGPATTNSLSITAGVRVQKTIISLQLKATEIGNHKLESPVFWQNGQSFKTKEIELKVVQSDLSEEEIKLLEREEFRKSEMKNAGTLRIVFDNEKAFLEQYSFFGWKFKRWLTDEELELIQDIR
jgi:hypothetical protein